MQHAPPERSVSQVTEIVVWPCCGGGSSAVNSGGVGFRAACPSYRRAAPVVQTAAQPGGVQWRTARGVCYFPAAPAGCSPGSAVDGNGAPMTDCGDIPCPPELMKCEYERAERLWALSCLRALHAAIGDCEDEAAAGVTMRTGTEGRSAG